MRPRSKLLSKGGLQLPTISEGTEETLRDLNEANTQCVADQISSDDYLLSICHLAHPTFPTGEVSPGAQQLDGVHKRMRSSTFQQRQKGVQQSRSRAYPHDGSEWERPIRSRAHSMPHTASPGLPRQRKSSCPEIHGNTGTTVSSVSVKHDRPTLTAEKGSVADSKVDGEGVNPNKRHSMVSQWISDCRSAWREGRMRACMLPAITEI
ncbi:uncharacterized protein LOC144025863 isoform X2 [Festucalex cinctus]